MFTSLPMLIKPVLSYLPSQYHSLSLVSPLRLTVMLQQGNSGWFVQMRLASSSKFPLLLKCQPVLGGWLGSTLTGAFSRATIFSPQTSPTIQLSLDLNIMRIRGKAFLTCKARSPAVLESLWSRSQCQSQSQSVALSLLSAPVCRLESPRFLHQAQDQTCQRLSSHGCCCSHPRLTETVLQYHI